MNSARVLALLALLAAAPLQAQFRGLPEWAQGAAGASIGRQAPEGADAWVLLDRTVLSYRGEGEIRKSRTRVVRVLTQKGLGEGTFLSRGLGQKVSRIHKLKGWNLLPDGTITRLDRENLIRIDADAFEERVVSAETLALATLPSVQPGSLVAFESQESIRFPLGPVDIVVPLERSPIRHYRFELETDLRWFSSSKAGQVTFRLDCRNLDSWSRVVSHTDHSVELENLPAQPMGELWASPGLADLPYLSMAFTDPHLAGVPGLSGWEAYGKWIHQRYSEQAEEIHPVPLAGKGVREALQELTAWMRESLSYRQVYLSPERGWIPERSSETLRRRYGDCKDLATCVMGGAKAASLAAWPVLARVGRGRIPADSPVNPFIFNHAIVAIRIPEPLGFPAEIDTPAGRFLLMDPTSRTTPLGWLPEAHRHGRLLLCGPEHSLWLEVPDRAIEEEKVEYRIEGQVDPKGQMRGLLKVLEFGDAMGFRSTALLEGSEGLRTRTLGLSVQSMPVEWVLVSSGLPTDLAHPFEFHIRFECGESLIRKGPEWQLRIPSFPGLPRPLPRVRGRRLFPIEVSEGSASYWRAFLTFEPGILPRGGQARLVTPLREVTWQATSKRGALDLVLNQTLKSAHWTVADQDQGLEVLRQDRGDLLRFLENAFFFSVNPDTASGHN